MIYASEQRRLAPEATALDDVTAMLQRGAALEGISNVLAHDVGLPRHDEGTDMSRRIIAGESDAADALSQTREHLREHPVIHINSLERLTGLAGGEQARTEDDPGGTIEIRIVRDDQRILAAEFKECRNKATGRVFGDDPPRAYAAGADHCVHLLDELGARAAGSEHDAGDGCDRGYLVEDLLQRSRVPRRHFARLQDHGSACEQRGQRIDHRQDQREIPRCNHADERVGRVMLATDDAGDRRRSPLVTAKHLARVVQPKVDHALHRTGLDMCNTLASRVVRECGLQSG